VEGGLRQSAPEPCGARLSENRFGHLYSNPGLARFLRNGHPATPRRAHLFVVVRKGTCVCIADNI